MMDCESNAGEEFCGDAGEFVCRKQHSSSRDVQTLLVLKGSSVCVLISVRKKKMLDPCVFF